MPEALAPESVQIVIPKLPEHCEGPLSKEPKKAESVTLALTLPVPSPLVVEFQRNAPYIEYGCPFSKSTMVLVGP